MASTLAKLMSRIQSCGMRHAINCTGDLLNSTACSSSCVQATKRVSNCNACICPANKEQDIVRKARCLVGLYQSHKVRTCIRFASLHSLWPFADSRHPRIARLIRASMLKLTSFVGVPTSNTGPWAIRLNR